MAPVPLKSVSFVSSEDKLNPASNLLCPVQGGKWLCAAENKSRAAEVVLELSKRAKITSLEICNFGSAFLEVLVSDTSSPEEPVTLLPVSMLMSFQESRSGRNKNKTAIYGKEKLFASATCKKWNRVKIRCIQKYNSESQFGLRAVSVFTDSRDPNSTFEGALTSPPPAMAAHPATPTPKQQGHHQQRHKYPSLPSSVPLTPHTPRNGGTPSRTPREATRNRPKFRPKDHDTATEDYEFSGIERQSRLFKSCMQRKSEDAEGAVKGSNQILERISAERDKYREALAPQYHRQRLLKKELPKAQVASDFVDSYKKSKSSVELSGACRKMSSYDNEYEIGEEPENTWGWGKRSKSGGSRGRRKEDGWVSKRRKKLDGMVKHCADILKRVGHGESGCGTVSVECADEAKNEAKNGAAIAVTDDCADEYDAAYDAETDSGDEIVCGKVCAAKEDGNLGSDAISTPPLGEAQHVGSAGTAPSAIVECPLCSSFFPSYAIEVHASQCGLGPPRDSYSASIITID